MWPSGKSGDTQSDLLIIIQELDLTPLSERHQHRSDMRRHRARPRGPSRRSNPSRDDRATWEPQCSHWLILRARGLSTSDRQLSGDEETRLASQRPCWLRLKGARVMALDIGA